METAKENTIEPESEKDGWKAELRRVVEKKVDEPESVKEQIAKGKMDDPNAVFVELKRNLASICICIGYMISFFSWLQGALERIPIGLRIIFPVSFGITNVVVYQMGWFGVIIDYYYKNRENYKPKNAEESFILMICTFISHSMLFTIVVVIIDRETWTPEGIFFVSAFVASSLFHIWFYLPLFKRIIKA